MVLPSGPFTLLPSTVEFGAKTVRSSGLPSRVGIFEDFDDFFESSFDVVDSSESWEDSDCCWEDSACCWEDSACCWEDVACCWEDVACCWEDAACCWEDSDSCSSDSEFGASGTPGHALGGSSPKTEDQVAVSPVKESGCWNSILWIKLRKT